MTRDEKLALVAAHVGWRGDRHGAIVVGLACHQMDVAVLSRPAAHPTHDRAGIRISGA